MKKFRHKPTQVEADRFDSVKNEACEGVLWDEEKHLYYCETLNGPIQVDDGDWIIKGVGEYYPVKPDQFHQRYDEIVQEKRGANLDPLNNFPTDQKCPKCQNHFLATNLKNQLWCSGEFCDYGVEKGGRKTGSKAQKVPDVQRTV